MGIGQDEMTPHGFRAMARTLLDEVLGERYDLIEMQLAHMVRDPNGRAYNRTVHLAERKRMMTRCASASSATSKTAPCATRTQGGRRIHRLSPKAAAMDQRPVTAASVFSSASVW